MQRAVNPQTGEVLFLVNNQWVPPSQTAINPETGQSAYLVNNEWQIVDPLKKPEEPGFLEEAAEGAAYGLRRVGDIGIGITQGIYTGVRGITDLFGADNPVSQALNTSQEALSRLLSAQAKGNLEEMAEITKEAEDKGTLDQLLAGLKAIGTAPTEVISQAFGTAIPVIAGGAIANLAKIGLTGTGLTAAQTTGTQAAIGAGMGAGMIKGQIYETVKEELLAANVPEDVAEERAVKAQEYGGQNLDQIILGAGLGAAAALGPLENVLTKLVTRQPIEQASKNIVQNMVRSGLVEAAPEAVQAAQEQVAQNLALKREGMDVPLFRGVVTQATIEGIAGGALGAGVGAVSRRPTPEAPPEVPPPAEPSPEPGTGPSVTGVTVDEPGVTPPVTPEPPVAPPEEPVGEPPVTPPEPPPVTPPEPPPAIPEPPVAEPEPPVAEPEPPVAEPEPPVTPPEIPPVTPPTVELTEEERAALSNYTAPGPEFEGAVLQNRDRSSQGSIDMMQSITAKPDYRRLSQSNILAEGAPVVVADLELSPAQLGRIDTATASDGRRFPVQYAVVSAGSLAPSNFADGTVNPIYQNLNQPAIRPVAGNGRVAGLQNAYSRGTAATYQADLSRDTAHGVSQDVISQIPDPVLVRIMPKSLVPSNIGDISNVSGVTTLTPVERAKTDLSRLEGKFDLAGLEFTAEGVPTINALRQFIQAMPDAERGSLMNAKTGEPNPDAMARLRNAIFYGAYQNEGLIDLYAATVDPDAKMYLNALARVAPSMVRLASVDPAYDVRPQVTSAVEDLVNAIRGGLRIKDLPNYVKQTPIDADPNTRKVLEFIVNADRSGTKIAEGLNGLAARAYELSQITQEPDMFGDVPPKPSVDTAFNELLDIAAPEPGGTIDDQPEDQPPPPPPPPPPKFDFTDKTPQQVDKELRAMKGDVAKLSKWMVDNAPNELSKEIAQKIKERLDAFAKHNVLLKFSIYSGGRRATKDGGICKHRFTRDSKGNIRAEVSIRYNGLTQDGGTDRNTRLDYITLMHELVHAATVIQLDSKYSKVTEATKSLEDMRRALRRRFEADIKNQVDHPALKNRTTRHFIKYATKNIHEFAAVVLSDGDVQDYLASIRYDNTNAFSKFVDILRRLFGLNKVEGSMLEEFVRTSDKLLSAPIQELKGNLTYKDMLNKGIFNKKTLETREVEPSGELIDIETAAAPRINIFGQPAPNPTWGRLDGSKGDNIIYVLQDKMIDTKRVLEKIQQAGKQIEDRWNAYLQEELYHGRTAKATEDFLNEELAPLLRDMKDRGVSIVELEEYLHNRHAEERNNQVAKVNPGMPDGGSGILTADAQAYLANLTPQQRTDFTALAAQVDAMTKKNRDLLVASGLETQDTINNWENAYKNYIPLAREEADYEMKNIGKGIGQGFSVKGPASRRAIGSQRNVIDILANIAMQRERTIVRSEKLRVGQAVYALATKFPNPDFYISVDPDALVDPQQTLQDLINMGLDPADAQNIVQEPTQSRVNPVTGQVEKYVNPLLRGADNVLPVRINGRERFVFFNTNDERAVRMITALKNLDADQLSRAVSMIQRVTRYFAAINTQYNPIFGVINFLRDVQGGMIQLTDTPLAGEQKAVLAGTMPALRGIYADLRSRRKGQGPAQGQWSNLWEEFQKEGGQTGFRQQFSQSEERQEAIATELKKLSEGKVMKGGRAVFDLLSDYNTTMENAIRLSAYKAGLDKGLSKQQAASLAKNLTVNFNKKGQISNQVGAWYAFFNAAVQGTTRMAKALRGPAGKKIFYGGLLIGAAQAMMLALAGYDEDEPPDFIKDRNFVIPLPDGKYITIPMPLGYNVIPATSRIITEWMLSGGRDTPKRIAHLLDVVLDAFNPIGNAGLSMQTFAPTVFDPGVALFENRDWTGKPIAKEDISSLDPTPGYTRAKETASTISKYLSEFLNFATGGTDYKPGVVSPTPDQIDYLIGQITGGVGRELMKAEQTVTAGVTGEELPPYKIPLVGRFYGDTSSQAAQRSKFYDNMIELNKHENEIKGRRKDRKNVTEYTRENPEAKLFGVANNVERQVRALRKQRERLLEKDAPREEVQRIEKKITEVMIKFNERYEKAKER